ncbi:MAG TPA: hypothetical protein VGE23_01705, partial [Candidatus Paceibacterota bacterium]
SGRYQNSRKTERFDFSQNTDEEARDWASRFCADRPAFKHAHLVEVIRVGEYRPISLSLA